MADVNKGLVLTDTSEPLRLRYDASNYAQFVVTSGGDLTVTPSGGDLTLSSTLTVTGAVTMQSTLDVTGIITLSGRVETGAVLVGINESANANMTVGLTINQGANDDEILALKSSDVAHGMTDFAETDTYFFARRSVAASGGVLLSAFIETGNVQAMILRGASTDDDTAKTTAARAPINLDVRKKSVTGYGPVGADANLAVIHNNGTTRFIFDAEGSAHADVEWTTFDQLADLAVIEDMETLLAPGQVERRFGEVVKHDRGFFEREGLLHDVRDAGDGRMRGMLNTTKALMLGFGAIRQVGGDVQRLERAFLHLLDNPNDRDGALKLLEA